MLGELGHLVSFLIPLLDTKSVSSQSHTLLVIYPIQGTKQQWVPLGQLHNALQIIQLM